jgi:hypothetical protein
VIGGKLQRTCWDISIVSISATSSMANDSLSREGVRRVRDQQAGLPSARPSVLAPASFPCSGMKRRWTQCIEPAPGSQEAERESGSLEEEDRSPFLQPHRQLPRLPSALFTKSSEREGFSKTSTHILYYEQLGSWLHCIDRARKGVFSGRPVLPFRVLLPFLLKLSYFRNHECLRSSDTIIAG